MTIENIEDALKDYWKKKAGIQKKEFQETGEGIIHRHIALLLQDLDIYELSFGRGVTEGRKRERERYNIS